MQKNQTIAEIEQALKLPGIVATEKSLILSANDEFWNTCQWLSGINPLADSFLSTMLNHRLLLFAQKVCKSL